VNATPRSGTFPTAPRRALSSMRRPVGRSLHLHTHRRLELHAATATVSINVTQTCRYLLVQPGDITYGTR